MSRLLFVESMLWSIIGDSGFVVSSVVPSTQALLSFHILTGKMETRPGTTYRSYSLAHSYRHNGTNCKDIVLKLGKLSDEEAGRWRALLQAAKTPHTFFTTLHDLTVTHRYAYLDVAVANAVWQAWQLDTVFRPPGKRALSLATMARILTLNRCIDPAAKSKTPDWF